MNKEPLLSTLQHVALTVQEAAWVAQVSPRFVQEEIDKKIVCAERREGRRAISRPDLLYLFVVRHHHAHMAPAFRREVRNAVFLSTETHQSLARIDPFCVSLKSVVQEVEQGIRALERLRRDFVESRPGALGGEPVLKGTRLSLRHLRSLHDQGMTVGELIDEFDLTQEQVDAALLLAKIGARRGRPPAMSKAALGVSA